MKKCPFCAEQIQDEAIKCRYCGSMLDGSASAPRARDSGLDQEALGLAAAGRKIEAIKLVRLRTGVGLAEAKAYVDALEAGRDPVRMPVTPPTLRTVGAPFVLMILIVIAAIAGLAYWLLSSSRG